MVIRPIFLLWSWFFLITELSHDELCLLFLAVGGQESGCDKKQEQKHNSLAAFASSTNQQGVIHHQQLHLNCLPNMIIMVYSVQYSLVTQTPNNYMPSPVLPFVMTTAVTCPVAIDLASLATAQVVPHHSDLQLSLNSESLFSSLWPSLVVTLKNECDGSSPHGTSASTQLHLNLRQK